ncbi:MAG TPA: glycogen synthase GlgA [Burkholderiaceae bacterium]|nr:glycogen synthase GlgA [Burkholderiaceae bacterium]
MSATTPLRILFATPEAAPWVKTGGLGDVSAALPAALAEAGLDVRVLLPAYPALVAAFPARTVLAQVERPGGELLPATISRVQLQPRLELLLVECPAYYERHGGPYQDRSGHDWPDNALRFGLLSRLAALLASNETPLDWRPDVLHCNDWQAALAPAYLRYRHEPVAATITTIHNLAFQGLFPMARLHALDLPVAAMAIDGVEFHGKISFLKAGLQHSDRLTTVSPTYAREICEPAHGFGLDGLLRHRRDRRSGDLVGILNGIDTREWDPATDRSIAARYSARSLALKQLNRAALGERLGLALQAETPLLGMISRITSQKGADLVIEAAPELLARGARLAVLGSGDVGLEARWRALAGRHPDRIAVQIGFDEALAHLIEAGADMFLMPSRFEPCGLNQMYSLAYGTPPVVRATGGLADTVVDCTPEALADGSANGFSFGPPTAGALLAAIDRAIELWRDPDAWRRLQRSGMARDWGWGAAARQYADLYRSCLRDAQ